MSTLDQPATFFGHPRGLATLFFTEMWERFSFYGMRALLILFMTATLAEGGLGYDTASASAIYALYTSMVYQGVSLGARIARELDDLLTRDGAASVQDVSGVESQDVAPIE